MRKVSKFIAIAGATALMGAVGALLALFGFTEVTLVATNLAIAMVAVTVVLADRRRRQADEKVAKRLSRVSEIEKQVGRTDKRVSMMQRRVMASLEAARFEAAERERRAHESRG